MNLTLFWLGFWLNAQWLGVGKKYPLYITASGNMLTSGNISLKLFMAPLETVELLTFWYVVAEHHIAPL